MMRIFVTIAFSFLYGSAVAAELIAIPLKADGLHDTSNPAYELLQEPAEALSLLPVDQNGKTDWVRSIQNGYIQPRTGLTGKEAMKELELEIVMKNTASMPHVMFSHSVHTQWLTCSSCHSRIFLPQIGANFITEKRIKAGEYCGVCHGKVAFSTEQCERCHTVTNEITGLR
ncbi:MAG: hypothetical protein OEZ16_01240 [Chromatiales bacterium]|nr:hypothetical protein [Chromatiales bacterium]